jgi:hypothetical protein
VADVFYAGEVVEIVGVSLDAKGRPRVPQPDLGLTVQIKDETEANVVLAEAAMSLLLEDSGTSTGSNTSTTLKDTGKTWTADEWKGLVVKITAGTGSGQQKRIKSNTADTLTIEGSFIPVPDATSQYQIHRGEYNKLWGSPAARAGQTLVVIVRANDSAWPVAEARKTELKLEGPAV